jgi:MraZ protein
MFLGTFTPRLDDKGRLFLPAKFREGLASGLVITKGQERCLRVFPLAEFTRITERLRDAPLTTKITRDFQRMIFAGAHDEVPDRQGRVMVPGPLRQYAGLVRDCAVVGMNTHLEIWDAQTWATYEASQEEPFSSLSEEVPGIL